MNDTDLSGNAAVAFVCADGHKDGLQEDGSLTGSMAYGWDQARRGPAGGVHEA